MKTKEEVIKEAWGISTYLGSVIDKNGWLSDKYLTNKQCVEFNDNIDLEYDTELGYRPKSLQGIENNNGWIRIENESDLPEKGEYYWTVTEKNKTPLERWFNKNWMINDGDGEITHYQPIVKPNKPLY